MGQPREGRAGWQDQGDVRADDLEAHDRLRGKFTALLDAMRGKDEVIDRSTYLSGRLRSSGVAHRNATAHFGHDQATSVVGGNCRMHDVDNLYVVDSSFFPSSSAVTPTLTIIANPLRVGDDLAERLEPGT